ncbi:glycosyltransferase [Aquabacterium sp.]|uniref:glycosyltransferase family 2 protein n=1 Tax=Aquabacterium sp. TaxID=1872578 RepID=UPI0035B3B67E
MSIIKTLREWNKKRLHLRRRGRHWATYGDWIKQQSQHCAVVSPNAATVLVVVDVTSCSLKALIKTCDTLAAQVQSNWLVRFVCGNSTNARDTFAMKRAISSLDARATWCDNDQARVSLAKDIESCQIEWLCLLEAGNTLTHHAFASVLNEASCRPGLRLIYGDHDHIDSRETRFAPHFKPDLNPEMLLSWNYIGNTFFIRAADLSLDDLFRDQADLDAQRWRILLKATNGAHAEEVCHLPQILHHVWHDGTKARPGQDDVTCGTTRVTTGMAAVLKEHLDQHMPRSTFSELPGHIGFHVHFAIPEPAPLVTIVIPTRNAKQLVEQCVGSLLAVTDYPSYEIILIDNGSDDPAALDYFQKLAQDPRVRVIRDDRPFNYSALNNAAIPLANGELILLLNNDTEFKQSEWLREMVSLSVQPGIGCVGAKLLYPNGNIQHVGVITGIGGVAGHAYVGAPGNAKGYFNRALMLHSVSVVTAACLMIKRSVYEEVGGLNEADLAVAYNDVDFCLRVRDAGYRNVLTPFAVAYHHETATRGSDFDRINIDRFRREQAYMLRVWGATLEYDPAYNVNLTLKGCNFEISPQPRTYKHA